MALEKPALADERIAACLAETYGLTLQSIEFLPIGYDSYAAVYRVTADTGVPYFLKAKRDGVREVSLALPRYLIAHGMPNVVAPLPTTGDALYGVVDGWTLIVYPYVDGQSGMEIGLTDQQWVEYGASLRRLHDQRLPDELAALIPRETFIPNPHWAEMVRHLHRTIPTQTYADPYAVELADFWRANYERIGRIVERAEALGQELQGRSHEDVLCHADIHTANLLVDRAGTVYLVDWDQPIYAPKERDLMFIVGGRIGPSVTTRQESLFFEGYGTAEIDRLILAYYRYEWVVQDMGGFAEPVFLSTDAGDVTKEDSVRHFKGLFSPGDVAEIAESLDGD